jgi:hypothetical protein
VHLLISEWLDQGETVSFRDPEVKRLEALRSGQPKMWPRRGQARMPDDETMAVLAADAARRVRAKVPLVRVTMSSIQREAGGWTIKANPTHSRYRPKTVTAILPFLEDREAFTKRRLLWEFAQMRERGEELNISEAISRTGRREPRPFVKDLLRQMLEDEASGENSGNGTGSNRSYPPGKYEE